MKFNIRTFTSKPIQREWIVIDGKDQVLGRLAVQIANSLTGKDQATYTPHMACGKKVIVINAEHIKITGKKYYDKKYYRHSGYAKGFKSMNYSDLFTLDCRQPLRKAVHGMLPKNKLGHQLLGDLKIYKGDKHPHSHIAKPK